MAKLRVQNPTFTMQDGAVCVIISHTARMWFLLGMLAGSALTLLVSVLAGSL